MDSAFRAFSFLPHTHYPHRQPHGRFRVASTLFKGDSAMDSLGEMDLEEAAIEAAGNWKRFNCFVWYRDRELDDADNWAIIYTHNRDSGLLEQSNAAVITKVVLPFTEAGDPDVVFESHNHWAVGHVDGFSVRVFKDGKITDAFRTYHKLAERMDIYPILDENDYSEREVEATFANIADSAWRLKNEFDLPNDWVGDVYSWFSENNDRAIDNRDDQGGCPKEDELTAAFTALGYPQAA
jgi:hypothetical protein